MCKCEQEEKRKRNTKTQKIEPMTNARVTSPSLEAITESTATEAALQNLLAASSDCGLSGVSESRKSFGA